MPFPFAAAIVYGAFAGGGLAATAASLQRLYNYLTSDAAAQDAADEQLSVSVTGIAEALARARFGAPIMDISPDQRQHLEAEAATAAPQFKKELNEAAKQRYGKPFHNLKKAEKLDVDRWLKDQYSG